MNSRLFQNLMAALALAFFTGICFQALIEHPNDVLVGIQDNGHNDTTNQFIAFKSYQKDCLEQQQFPFWNPYSLLGMPWLGSPQSSLFYPGNWIFFFTNALTTISWTLIFHHWWAGWGAYLLGRKYHLSFFSSLLSGIIFLAAPYFIAKTGEGHFTSITQIAWFPWIFYGFELLIEGRKKAIPILAMLISFAFFCGHVQELYYLLLFFTVSVLFESLIIYIRKRKEVQSDQTTDNQNQVTIPASLNTAGGLIKGWMLAGILTIGLVAIDLIPVYIYSQQAVRASGIDLAALQSGSLALPSLIQLLDPFVWGSPDNYRGPGGFYWEAICYFGCLPLLLACLGMLTAIKNRTVIRLLLFGLISFLLAFGPNLPVYTLFYDIIPGFSMFRIPARFLWICSLVVAMLAGFGCDYILTLSLNSRRKFIQIVSLICLVSTSALLAYLIYSSQGLITLRINPERIVKIQLIYFICTMPVIALAIFAACHSRKTGLWGIILLCFFSSWELSTHSKQILRTIPQSSFRADSKVTKFLKANLGPHRVLAEQKILSDREAWSQQLLKVQGYER